MRSASRRRRPPRTGIAAQIAAARAHFDAGDPRRAGALAHELHARPRAGRRAEALVLLSDIEAESGRLERSIQLRREALEAAAGQPTLLVEIHKWLGSFARFTEGEAAGDRHAAAALELAEAVGDDSLRAGALFVLAFGRFRAGSPGGLSLVEQTVQLATSAGDPRQRLEINFMAVNPLVWAYQLDRARSLLQSIDREWRERDEPAKAYVLWWLGMMTSSPMRPVPARCRLRGALSGDRAPIHDRRPRRAGRLARRTDCCASGRARSRALPSPSRIGP